MCHKASAAGVFFPLNIREKKEKQKMIQKRKKRR